MDSEMRMWTDHEINERLAPRADGGSNLNAKAPTLRRPKLIYYDSEQAVTGALI